MKISPSPTFCYATEKITFNTLDDGVGRNMKLQIYSPQDTLICKKEAFVDATFAPLAVHNVQVLWSCHQHKPTSSSSLSLLMLFRPLSPAPVHITSCVYEQSDCIKWVNTKQHQTSEQRIRDENRKKIKVENRQKFY